ncbi:hypothetical protein HNO88_003985 [Novosphingobium chloroacetimidivorans]|uniref:Uncharacterized protein n=1 Tax=Novosphingobium chloroacetimidivorans TaxID=1428314 RepID=A0A7W7KDY9_9SPHN|nr:hypothetical protein [Novosphingobium chloroacetimidivorans]
MTMREAHSQALASGTATMAAGHVGRSPCFVDKDEALWLEIKLVIKPGMALPQDIGSVLLDRVTRLFLRVIR